MTRQHAWMAALALGLGLAGLLRAEPVAAPGDALGKLIKARRDAARQTYDVEWKNYQQGFRASGELVYRWSCRLLEADRAMSDLKMDQLAAWQAHWQRMRDLEKIAKENFRLRLATIQEVTGAEFYTLEAEIWLTQAKGK
jgi:hypothetical protein